MNKTWEYYSNRIHLDRGYRFTIAYCRHLLGKTTTEILLIQLLNVLSNGREAFYCLFSQVSQTNGVLDNAFSEAAEEVKWRGPFVPLALL